MKFPFQRCKIIAIIANGPRVINHFLENQPLLCKCTPILVLFKGSESEVYSWLISKFCKKQLV